MKSHYSEYLFGNIVQVTNWNGDEVLRAQYDVYGRVRFLQNGQPYYNHTMTRFWYTGREMLGNEYGGIGAGLYDYRNRIYSTVHGRFLQPDPIGFDAKDVNWYRYVNNSPLNYTDPEGLAKYVEYFICHALFQLIDGPIPPCALSVEGPKVADANEGVARNKARAAATPPPLGTCCKFRELPPACRTVWDYKYPNTA
ncbi:MAG: RHS repeat-associated core domain-containing protein [Methylacidiphilales bacterium]|nr:RHS repeat-associated core domain-containing protein [Candidatus Methylacidiphilales bacterium]